MTDRIDELQRLHEHVGTTRAAAIKDERKLAAFAYALTSLADASEKHLPALLRVARAAKRVHDASLSSIPGVWTDALAELFDAGAELEKP